MERAKISPEEAAAYCLVEAEAGGEYNRIIGPEEYPLAISTSPFHRPGQEIYLCHKDQAEDSKSRLETGLLQTQTWSCAGMGGLLPG